MVLYGLVGRSKQAIMQSCNHAIMHPDPQVRLSLAKPPNFIQIGWKTQKLKIFTIGRFWLVGPVGQKMVAAASNIQNLKMRWGKISRWANLANFHPIQFKLGTEVICNPPNEN